MNKRITSILLCFVMMFSMLATAVPALAASPSTCTFTVEADKSEAHRGDTITFTVYMQQTGKQNTLEFTVVPPEGLTYVANSGTAAEGISETLGWTLAAEGAGWTEQSMYYSGFGAYSYTGTEKIVLMTFKCTVDDDAAFKTYEFGLVDHWADDETYNTKNAVVVPATFSVVAKPVAVTGVTIDETLSVKTGELKTPSYTVNPAEATNKAVSFKSDNPAVATVNATTGEVTGVKEGTATITITTADGNFTDTCVVTVACSHANKTPVAEKASDCKNKGWDAYVKCDDCGQLFAEDGTTEIAEIPFRELSSEHTGGTATCTAQAVCTVCSQPYGDLAAHSYTAADKKAEALKSEGNCCDYAVYFYSCSACGKVENNDSHVFLGEKNANNHVGGTALVNQSEENHKTQTDGYTGDTKCLGCNEIIGYGQSIPAGAHTPANVWSNDPTHHWKECTVTGCGIVIDGSKAEHKSEKAENKAACEKQAVCDVCGVGYGEIPHHNYGTEKPEQPAEIGKTGLKAHYQCSECEKYFVDVDHDTHVEKKEVAYEDLIIPALVDNELTFEIPFSVVVKKTGDLDPAKETFTFKMFDLGYADTIYTVEGLTVETNGVNTYNGKLVIKVKESQFGNLSEGFKLAQIKGSSDGWTYDETVYYIAPQVSATGVTSFTIYPENAPFGNDTLEKVEFTNSYAKAQEPTQPGVNDNKPSDDVQSPQTGDNSMMWLWVALLFVSGFGVVATTVLGKKRFVK